MANEKPQAGKSEPAGTVPANEAKPANRFASMFLAASFTPSTNTEVYTNRRGKSRQMAHVTLPIRGVEGATIPGTIYARVGANGGDPVADFVCSRGGIEVDKTNAKAMSEWIEFASMVASDFYKWYEGNGGAASVVATKANGPTIKGLTL